MYEEEIEGRHGQEGRQDAGPPAQAHGSQQHGQEEQHDDVGQIQAVPQGQGQQGHPGHGGGGPQIGGGGPGARRAVEMHGA